MICQLQWCIRVLLLWLTCSSKLFWTTPVILQINFKMSLPLQRSSYLCNKPEYFWISLLNFKRHGLPLTIIYWKYLRDEKIVLHFAAVYEALILGSHYYTLYNLWVMSTIWRFLIIMGYDTQIWGQYCLH